MYLTAFLKNYLGESNELVQVSGISGAGAASHSFKIWDLGISRLCTCTRDLVAAQASLRSCCHWTMSGEVRFARSLNQNHNSAIV